MDNLNKWIGYLILIDLLLLPYFQKIIMPYSLPFIVIAFFLYNKSYKIGTYERLYIVITASILISLLISLFIPTYADYFIVNIKYALQFISTFFYFFYFRLLASNIKLNINPILYFFIALHFSFGVYFYYLPFEATDLLINIFGRLVNEQSQWLEEFRYSYFFQDPNTSIYFFLIALAPLLHKSNNIFIFVTLLFIGVASIIISQSSGGLVAFILMSIFAFKYNDMISSQLSKKILIIVLFAGIIYIFSIYIIISIDDNIILDTGIDRLFGSTEKYTGGSGRFDHWAALYTRLDPLPFGRGYQLYDEGYIKPPHSDFFGLLYRYGFIALIASLLFFFRKYRESTILIIPAAIAFFINTLIDEQKLLALFLSLLAINNYSNHDKKDEKKLLKIKAKKRVN